MTYTETLEKVPQKLKEIPHWILWNLESRPGDSADEITKVPYRADGSGRKALVNDSETWGTYEQAVAHRNGYAGLGFVLAEGDDLVFIDLDGCINAATGEIAVWALGIVQGHQTYWEKSPSLTGLHGWARGTLPDSRRRFGSVEMYESGRYATITGLHVEGTPLTIEFLALEPLHMRMKAGEFVTKSITAPVEPSAGLILVDNYSLLQEGRWQECRNPSYSSPSEGDLGLCNYLKQDFSTVEEIDAAFRQSGMMRDKWDEMRGACTYGEMTIRKALASPPLIESTLVTDETLADWPASTLEGDYIADLTDLLTVGTPLPRCFVREQIILGLGALSDQLLGYPDHHDIPIRRYTALVSEGPEMGKGESHKRVLGLNPEGVLRWLLTTGGVQIRNGAGIGSSQYLAKILEENNRLLAVWDEATQLFQQTSHNSQLFSSMKSLFEGTQHHSGSLCNRAHGSDDAHLSICLQATRKVFASGFSLRGGINDGLLSRFVLAFANTWPVVPTWASRDYVGEKTVVDKLTALLPKTHSTPAIDADARECMIAFDQEINGAGRPHPEHTPRLLTHAKTDCLMRCVFSGSPTITRAMVERSIAWARHQLALRLEFWPLDADDKVPAMIQLLRRRLQKGLASDRDLCRAAHVDRDGTHEIYGRAKTAMLRSGTLTVRGKNRKGRDVYGLDEGGEQ